MTLMRVSRAIEVNCILWVGDHLLHGRELIIFVERAVCLFEFYEVR
jgi:hypothetical protein